MTHKRSAREVANRMERVEASHGLSMAGMSPAPKLIRCHKARSLWGIAKDARSLWGIAKDARSFWLRVYATNPPL